MGEERPLTIALPVERRLWHVTLTVGGPAADPGLLRAALERLATERPFLLSARYDVHRAEVRYWEEAGGLDEAVRLALGLWEDYRADARLAAWEVVGLEVMEQETFRWRAARPPAQPLISTGQVQPF